MTLILRPPGRGNWKPVVVTWDRPADLFEYRVNDLFPFGRREFRIVEIRP